MKNFHPKLDKKTGRFLPIPPGEKPQKMEDVEKILGVKFEKDYKDLYLSEKMGQKLFARRWRVSNKNLIFGKNLRGGRRSWIQMLDLPLRNSLKPSIKSLSSKSHCELYNGVNCKENNCPLERAHWIENRKGGSSKSNNILNLCPNCHTKLDSGDSLTVKRARECILVREVRKLIDSEKSEASFRERLVELCEKILGARR